MFTFTDSINLYKKFTKNSDTDNVSFGTIIINDWLRQIYSSYPWYFLESSTTLSTVASQQSYTLPYNLNKVVNLTVVVGSFRYNPVQVYDRKKWDKLNTNVSVKSDMTSYFFVYNNQLLVYPIPSNSSNTMTLNFKLRTKDIDIADYTTGTVTVTNGSTTITGSATTFTSAMVGRWFKVSADKGWYKISAYVSATEITLANAYQGTTSSGSSYTIGEVSLLPEDFQTAPVYRAASIYWLNNDSQNKSKYYENLFLEIKTNMERFFNNISENMNIDEEIYPINPNLYITQ